MDLDKQLDDLSKKLLAEELPIPGSFDSFDLLRHKVQILSQDIKEALCRIDDLEKHIYKSDDD